MGFHHHQTGPEVQSPKTMDLFYDELEATNSWKVEFLEVFGMDHE